MYGRRKCWCERTSRPAGRYCLGCILLNGQAHRSGLTHRYHPTQSCAPYSLPRYSPTRRFASCILDLPDPGWRLHILFARPGFASAHSLCPTRVPGWVGTHLLTYSLTTTISTCKQKSGCKMKKRLNRSAMTESGKTPKSPYYPNNDQTSPDLSSWDYLIC